MYIRTKFNYPKSSTFFEKLNHGEVLAKRSA